MGPATLVSRNGHRAAPQLGEQGVDTAGPRGRVAGGAVWAGTL